MYFTLHTQVEQDGSVSGPYTDRVSGRRFTAVP